MRKLLKKDKALIARIPFADHEMWSLICSQRQISSSEGVRAAVASYAKSFGYELSVSKDDRV